MKKLLAILLATAMLLLLCPAAFASDGRTEKKETRTGSAPCAPNRVIVLYEAGAVNTTASAVTTQSLVSAHRAAGFGASAASVGDTDKTERTLQPQVAILDRSLRKDYVINDTFVVDAGDGSELIISVVSSDSMRTEELIARLRDNPAIRSVEPDYEVHTSAFSDWNDPYMNSMYHLVGENSIHADALWESPDYAAAVGDSAAEPVIVAVVDTGVDYLHPDLAGRMWIKPSDGAFRNFSGRYGYNFVDYTGDPMDDNGHGTHCAGIIAAQADNAAGTVGVAGAADQVKIMAVKVMDRDGICWGSEILAGFRYVIEMKKAGANIRVMSCSFGGGAYSAAEEAMIEAAGKAGILTVAAAGNESADNDVIYSTPSNADSDYLIAVAASDENGALASYSNYGMKEVDVVAPGSNILSAYPFYNYLPFLYDAETLRSNTLCYGEFDGAAVEKVTNLQGETVDAVTPVIGTDCFGDPIDDPAHSVGAFGRSVMLINRVDGSRGVSTLELTDDGAFPLGNNRQYLRWRITDAKAGDAYLLFFPYEKAVGYNWNQKFSFVFRAHAEEERDLYVLGDIRVNGLDRNNHVSWGDVGRDGYSEGVYSIDPGANSIWSTNRDSALYPYSEVLDIIRGGNPEEDMAYGLGIVYTPYTDGDCWFDISSLAIAKADADETTFGKYCVMSGTSMATPVVSGAVATLAAMYPELSAKALRTALLSATDGRFDDWGTSLGMLDLSLFRAPDDPGKPVITDVLADLAGDTVTLCGKGFGSSPKVQIRNNCRDEGFRSLPDSDLRLTADGIVILHADAQYGIIGTDVSFVVENTDSGETGHTAAYVVKGLAPYDEGFELSTEIPVWGEGEEGTFAYALRPISGADRLLMYDPAGNLYELDPTEPGVQQLGPDIRQAVEDYIAGRRSAEDSVWGKAEQHWMWQLSAPAYLDGSVYALVHVQLEYINAALLLGLRLDAEPQWTVYYDSLDGFGTAPEALNWNGICSTTLAAYGDRLYCLGSILSEEKYAGETEDGPWYSEDNILTAVFSCAPASAGERGADWRTENAGLPCPRANGVPVVQNGSLYYVLSTSDAETVDYSVYRYDGTAWSVAGTLPEMINPGEKYYDDANYGDYRVSFSPHAGVPCAVGADEAGILFGGASFEDVGDTFRFNTATGTVEALPYSLWGTIAGTDVFGTTVDGRLWAGYIHEMGGAYWVRYRTLCSDETTAARPFADVKESDWFSGAVLYCCERGYFKGVGESRFDPAGSMSRAMFAAVLYRMAGQPAVRGTAPFPDVEAGCWYTDAVTWAAQEGIIDGYGDGTFGVNDAVTREQLVTQLWRWRGRPAAEGADLSGFTDADRISPWAADAFRWAVGAGIVHGNADGSLNPGGTASRAEVAQIVRNHDMVG